MSSRTLDAFIPTRGTSSMVRATAFGMSASSSPWAYQRTRESQHVIHPQRHGASGAKAAATCSMGGLSFALCF